MSTASHRDPASRPRLPPEAWEPLSRLARLAGRPLERFLRIEAASGILLLLAAGLAMGWANSPWAETHVHLWHTPIGLRIGQFVFERTLEWFVNDVLMVLFFFVVGLEIRRELHHGELSDWRRAALPAAAALGGMVVPAGFYLVLAGGAPTRSGWGVPMATDIAFAVGILTLLGKRMPVALRVLLLALAIIDDLGAIVVIAVFYSSGLATSGFLTAAVGLGALLAMQRVGVRSKLAYVVPATVVWAGIYAAGVHPTIAGVIVGLLTPVRAWFGAEGFLIGIRDELERLADTRPSALSTHELNTSLQRVAVARREALSPAESLIETLHPWVAFGIMPLFALANAGVSVSAVPFDALSRSVVVGVAVGLVLGKPVGVLLTVWLMLHFGIGALPKGMTLRHVIILGVVAGVGFTMALFIAQLAFPDPGFLSAAKMGVLLASAAAAVLSLVLGRLLLHPFPAPGAARTADEAESSTQI